MEMKKITNCKYNLKYDYYITDSGNVYSGKTNLLQFNKSNTLIMFN